MSHSAMHMIKVKHPSFTSILEVDVVPPKSHFSSDDNKYHTYNVVASARKTIFKKTFIYFRNGFE